MREYLSSPSRSRIATLTASSDNEGVRSDKRGDSKPEPPLRANDPAEQCGTGSRESALYPPDMPVREAYGVPSFFHGFSGHANVYLLLICD